MLYDLTVVQYRKMLENLGNILTKAEQYAQGKNIDMEVLLNSRLAPDQFNLTRQVQVACDSAKLAVARLTNRLEQAPKHPDTEVNLVQLQARVKSVREYLAGFQPEDFAGAEEVRVVLPYFGGKYLTGRDFALQFAIPNFYFHVTTAYEILRHNGVELGKADYIGNLPLYD